MIRFAFLATTAGLMASTMSAHAADLPIAPEPVDYLRICDAFGSRFYYIPGTETCLRVSGRVRAEFRVRNFGKSENAWGARNTDGYQSRARGYVYLDARSATDFGTLRTYMEIYGTATNANNTSFTLDDAFIQWGGLLAGRAPSNFDFFTGYSFNAQIESYTDQNLNQAAYTFDFGNGFNSTFAIEDRSERQQNLAVNGGNQGYGGTRLPDFVAAFGLNQNWGTAQLMGALHQIYPNSAYKAASANSSNSLGWAIGGAVELKSDSIGNGTRFSVQAVYTDGASAYGSTGWNSRISDAVFNGTNSKSTKTWNIFGGIRQDFAETFQLNLEGGYHNVVGGTNAYDFTQWDASANIVWEPISGFIMGPEVQYRNVDFSNSSGLSDTNEWYGTVRMQRTF
ncbi:MAG: porin [Roseibium sp.]